VQTESDLVEVLTAIHRDRSRRTYLADAVRRFVQDAVCAGEPGRDVLGSYATFIDTIAKRDGTGSGSPHADGSPTDEAPSAGG
jgi:hypothetical protein